ncbi:MAG: Hsp20/alpha crystallin family protein [Firmicutes bacterium]|jgi:HSP20 family protein|nr:Hsp20/alpha crystallin family protein [Bacillota bacterium]
MANLIPFRHRRMLRSDWNPWDDFMQLANMFGDRGMMPSFSMAYPAVDVEDTPEAYLVKANVPGYAKDDLEIELEGNMVTIKGNTVAEEQTQSQDLIHQERCTGEFRRTFALPTDIDAENAEATFDHGVLEIRLPKARGKGRRLTIN